MTLRAPALADTVSTHRSLTPAHARLAARDDAILRTQITVAQIAAPTGEEQERAGWVARRFRDCGLSEIHTDDAGNVIGRREGNAGLRPVVICAHLDTVFPRDTDLSIRRDGDRLVGPGINDNGRGLAVMLALAAEIDGVRLRAQHPIEFVATTGEEGLGDLRGAKHYFDNRGRDAHAMVALDGAGDERIIHRALGSRRFRVSYSGPGGHSWAAFGVPNAVHAAAGAASRLASLSLPSSPRTTLSVGRIGGGLSVNSIPDRAWLEIDSRSTSASALDDIERAIRSIAQIAADDENARRAAGTRSLVVQVEPIGARPCGETPADHSLVQAALEATRLVGRHPDLAGGRGGDAHTRSEWFDNLHGTLGVARALTIVMTTARLAS
jgi:acetylornithine deacetylase/succinyl-diaminopimelate desuccinylase-like protein